MSATKSTDWNFNPVVWQTHIDAYFRTKLVFGAFAETEASLTSEPGTTITFPYFKTIGAVEEPAEDEGLVVDNLSDDSFTATVKEVGKAVGIKKKAFKKSAAAADRLMGEAQRQIGRRMAEKVDADLLAEFSANGNYTDGFTAAAAGDTMSATNLLTARVVGYGDRQDEAVVVFMHSKQWLDLMSNSTSGFMKADALDPNVLVKGFMGYLLGMAVVISDQVPNNGGTQVGGKNTYNAFMHTQAAYAYITKQDLEVEDDYDILMREWVVTGNQWYAVKSYHSKISSLNVRTVRCTTTTTT
jgi:N4-gp56 family major capsid protein